ncbi:MAG: hypothetical protein ACXWLH_03520 [Candidatus Saccharimonadales bacterium]
MVKEVKKEKPEIQPKPARFLTPLILVTIAFIIIGVIVIFAGKAIVGGLLALLGAVFGLGSQVGKSNKF